MNRFVPPLTLYRQVVDQCYLRQFRVVDVPRELHPDRTHTVCVLALLCPGHPPGPGLGLGPDPGPGLSPGPSLGLGLGLGPSPGLGPGLGSGPPGSVQTVEAGLRSAVKNSSRLLAVRVQLR